MKQYWLLALKQVPSGRMPWPKPFRCIYSMKNCGAHECNRCQTRRVNYENINNQNKKQNLIQRESVQLNGARHTPIRLNKLRFRMNLRRCVLCFFFFFSAGVLPFALLFCGSISYDVSPSPQVSFEALIFEPFLPGSSWSRFSWVCLEKKNATGRGKKSCLLGGMRRDADGTTTTSCEQQKIEPDFFLDRSRSRSQAAAAAVLVHWPRDVDSAIQSLLS